MTRTARALGLLAGVLLLAQGSTALPKEALPPATLLKKGQRVAIVGDSITEQKLYSKYIELYLTLCVPELDLKIIQLGWGGETAGGFANRMNNDLLPWKPDVVTLCYGMNDGGYKPFEESTGSRYRGSLNDVVGRIEKAGGIAVVGSPGAVDTKYFGKSGDRPNDRPKMYNATLAKLRDIAHALADEHHLPFANIFDPMTAAMEAAKKTLGEDYDVCGRDGVHPGPNGHLVMAYGFLRALGLDGDIGQITLDLAKGEATASDGHRVLSADKTKVEIESTRYPFSFFGDGKSSGGTWSILPFVPFNAELNRLSFKVKGLEAPKAQVTWGRLSKSFSRAELEAGINLADQFEETPFTERFRQIDALVAAKQNFETGMIKQSITFYPTLFDASGKDKDLQGSLDTLRRQLNEIDQKKHEAVLAARVPVRHVIQVTPE